MPLLAGLAVVFVGIIDGGHAKVDQQLKTLVHGMHVTGKALPDAAVVPLARHSPTSTAIVKKLHARGAISFEVIDGREVHVATYGSDGVLKSYVELTLKDGMLRADDLATVRQSIAEDLKIEIDAPALAAKPVPKAAPKVEAVQPSAPIDDTEAVPGVTGGASGGAAASASSDAELHAQAPSSGGSFRAGAALGFGMIGRDFSTAPMTIKGYTSTPVPSLVVEGHLQPVARARLSVIGETTLTMHSALKDGSLASSSISRWEATAGYAVTGGTIEIAPTVGFGARSFAIDSTDTARSPDGNYSYLIAGVNAAMPVGGRFMLRGNALFEPAMGGAQSTTMTLGDASRWALALGASLEMRFTHVFARAGADWQRWSWTWDAYPGAVDSYFSGSVSVGADY